MNLRIALGLAIPHARKRTLPNPPVPPKSEELSRVVPERPGDRNSQVPEEDSRCPCCPLSETSSTCLKPMS